MRSAIDVENGQRRVLILGSTGFLGSRLFEDLSSLNIVLGTYFRTKPANLDNRTILNLTKIQQIHKVVMEFKPDCLINCSGMTDVDECEKRPEASIIQNAIVPFRLAKISKDVDARFIHISTDHFASTSNLPRTEFIEPIPINQYGYAKLLGEKLVKDVNPLSLIIRTNFFGLGLGSEKSLFNFAVENLKIQKTINGVTDIFFNPIGISFLSKFIQTQLNSNTRGIINVTGPEIVSKFEFLKLVCEAIGSPEKCVKPIKSQEIFLGALRPLYMALLNSNLLNDLNFQLPNLKDMIDIELITSKKVD